MFLERVRNISQCPGRLDVEQMTQFVQQYKNNGPYKKNDANGKELFDDLAAELSSNGKSREYLIDIVIRYMNANESQRVNKIVTFLKKQL